MLRATTATIMAGTAIVNRLRARIYLDRSINRMSTDMVGLAGCHFASMMIVATRLITMRWKEVDKVTYKYYYTIPTYVHDVFFYANIEKLSTEKYTG